MLISLTISIHAPRVGSDAQAAHQRKAGSHFNPRSPCGERHFGISFPLFPCYFNPRSPCGERRAVICLPPAVVLISIHAPRVGSDHRRP